MATGPNNGKILVGRGEGRRADHDIQACLRFGGFRSGSALVVHEAPHTTHE